MILLIKIYRAIHRKITSYIYKKLVSECGSDVHFDYDVTLYCPQHITIGNACTINKGTIIQGSPGGYVKIGNGVRISYNVCILSAGLNKDFSNHVYQNTTIGNNVWLAANVIVLPGVRIHDNVLVAAGAVVSKDLESGYLYAGVPAVKIKEL